MVSMDLMVLAYPPGRWVENSLERVLGVRGRELTAVMKLHALAQRELQLGRRLELPARRQIRPRLDVGAGPDQPRVDVLHDVDVPAYARGMGIEIAHVPLPADAQDAAGLGGLRRGGAGNGQDRDDGKHPIPPLRRGIRTAQPSHEVRAFHLGFLLGGVPSGITRHRVETPPVTPAPRLRRLVEPTVTPSALFRPRYSHRLSRGVKVARDSPKIVWARLSVPSAGVHCTQAPKEATHGKQCMAQRGSGVRQRTRYHGEPRGRRGRSGSGGGQPHRPGGLQRIRRGIGRQRDACGESGGACPDSRVRGKPHAHHQRGGGPQVDRRRPRGRLLH